MKIFPKIIKIKTKKMNFQKIIKLKIIITYYKKINII